jgi:hypothetical protein
MISSTRIENICRRMNTPHLAGAVALVALLGACSGDVVNIGDGDTLPPELPPAYSRCLASPTLEGSVVVSDQAQLDALDGCTTIVGDLYVQPLFYPDLRSLHALREVTGRFALSQAPLPEGQGQSARESQIMQAIYADWLPTLEGLESLESAGGVYIASASAPDLGPLSGLRQLTGDGTLGLEATDVRDLAPLAQLRGIRTLLVNGDQLESIADLVLPPVMTTVSVSGTQLTELGMLNQLRTVADHLGLRANTRDLSALAALEEVNGSLEITGNARLQSLDGLERLRIVGDSVNIAYNPALQSLDALAGLLTARSLQIFENESLARVPDFPELLTQNLGIFNNAELEEVVPFSGEQRRWGVLLDGTYRQMEWISESDYLQFRYERIDVFNNPKLRAYALPKELRGSKVVMIANNPSLTDLDLGSIEAIDMLSIKGNPALERVNLGSLATVDLLGVQGNPLLPLEIFDPVLTFERRMSSDPAPPPDCSNGECAP